MPTKVVFFLLPKLHLLDLAGPAQVFSTANDLGHGYDLYYVAEVDEITTAQGIPVKAQLDWPELGPADLIVVPGWRSPKYSPQAPIAAVTKQRLRSHHAGGGQIASVCSGADALGAAGLLDGRSYTTHHDLTD